MAKGRQTEYAALLLIKYKANIMVWLLAVMAEPDPDRCVCPLPLPLEANLQLSALTPRDW